jgi:hypothetical protein
MRGPAENDANTAWVRGFDDATALIRHNQNIKP